MFIIDRFNKRNSKTILLEDLRKLHWVAQQVVLSFGIAELECSNNRKVAFEYVADLLEDIDVRVPDEFIELSISASIYIANNWKETDVN